MPCRPYHNGITAGPKPSQLTVNGPTMWALRSWVLLAVMQMASVVIVLRQESSPMAETAVKLL